MALILGGGVLEALFALQLGDQGLEYINQVEVAIREEEDGRLARLGVFLLLNRGHVFYQHGQVVAMRLDGLENGDEAFADDEHLLDGGEAVGGFGHGFSEYQDFGLEVCELHQVHVCRIRWRGRSRVLAGRADMPPEVILLLLLLLLWARG